MVEQKQYDKTPRSMLSMTGFGEGQKQRQGVLIKVHVRSVNNKYFKLYSTFPDNYPPLGGVAEKEIRKKLHRGTVYLTLRQEILADDAVSLNEPLLERFILAGRKVAEHCGLDESLSLSELFTLPGVVQSPESMIDEKALQECFLEALRQALASLMEMRRTEGDTLKTELVKITRGLQADLGELEKRLPDVLLELKKNLQSRILLLLEEKQLQPDDQAFLREVAYLTEKSDITEEIGRLKSHIAQFEDCCLQGGEVGRRLDFLTQEMFREVNTMAAKAATCTLSERVINMKVQIDKLREQVQNIE